MRSGRTHRRIRVIVALRMYETHPGAPREARPAAWMARTTPAIQTAATGIAA